MKFGEKRFGVGGKEKIGVTKLFVSTAADYSVGYIFNQKSFSAKEVATHVTLKAMFKFILLDLLKSTS